MRASNALLATLVVSLSCGPQTSSPGPSGPDTDTRDPTSNDVGVPGQGAGPTLESVGLSSAAMDPSADPCQDFYQYACGGWIASTEIPPDQPRWSRSFNEIQKRNQEDMKRILTEATQQGSDDPVTQALGAYYGACMNEPAIEKTGLAGVEPFLAKARALRRRKQIGPLITELHTYGIFPAFTIDIDQDFKDPNKVLTFLDQGGLGLPDRDYYLEEQFKREREFYTGHVERMLGLAGVARKEAARAAKEIVKLETELAKVSKTRVERRDLPALYNKIDRAGVVKTVRNIDWKRYFAAQGVPKLKDVAVTSVKYFKGLDRQLKRFSPKTWGHYLQWTVIRSAAPTLPKTFVDEQFALQQVLTGQKEQRPRWKRCVAATDAALREYTGRAYVKLRFGKDAKQAVTMMIHAISDAFAAELPTYDWMDDATRKGAREKREKMAYLVGYPDKWRTYDFPLDPGTYTANWLQAQAFEQKLQWQKTQKPVDRRDWYWSAATVNAGYHPLRNNMTYPAGILQPPFYNPNANLAVNLGALGMVVGHELTHGFDDNGSLFDASGAMENWWSKKSTDQFNEKKQCVVEQYNRFEPLPGHPINGQLTLGENIADLGGVKLAYRAYRELRQDKQPRVAGGLTEDQQFFLAVGQTWCSKQTEELTKLRLKVDTHSPPRFRVQGAVQNLPEFAEAFSCDQGTPMHPEKICTVW